MPGSFLLAGDLLSNGATTTMDEECAAACLQLGTDKCQAWSWCGAFFTDGWVPLPSCPPAHCRWSAAEMHAT